MAREDRYSGGRRRFPRLDVDGNLRMLDVTLGASMEVQDVSLGGCRTLFPRPLDPGSRHMFEVTLPGLESTPLLLAGEVVHCRGAAGDRAPYTIGWQWMDDPATNRAVTRVIDYMTDVRAFAQPKP